MQRSTFVLECGPEADDGIIHRLEQIRRVIEDKFVAAGEILLKSLGGIDDLIESLDRFAKTFDTKIVAATRADLTVAAAKLCTLPAYHAHHLEQIAELARSRAKLGRHVSAMRCHLAFMGAFSRNAKLMAGAAMGEGLAGLADNIAICVTGGSAEIATLDDELTALQRDLESATTQGEILGHQITSLVPAVPEDLAAAARIVSRHYTAVTTMAEQVSGIARDIQKRVVRILAALQFGDITRQRIEHILVCLIQAEADAAFAAPQIRRRYRATCHALIAKQLAEIKANFDREIAEIEKNMHKMAADAKVLLKLHDIAFDRDGGRNNGFLHVLAARIDAALKLVTTIEAADRSAMETGRTTIATAHRLGQHIDHIQALRNQMGAMAFEPADDGASNPPLASVASEIRENGRLLEEAANVGLATLDKLLQLASAVIETGGDRCTQDSKSASAAAALTIAARRICEARDITENDLAEVAAQGDAVVHILSLSSTRLCLRREIGDILSFATTEATRLADGAYTAGDSLPEELIQTLMSFSETYTMAPERALHQAFLSTMAIDRSPTGRMARADDPGAVLF
jgi:hypothetical protein